MATLDTSLQIWNVNLAQKNSRNQHCRQEFLVLAATEEEATEKAIKRADKTRTVIRVDVSQHGDCYCVHS